MTSIGKKCSKKCEPRKMLGTSWWKQLGYNQPCGCAMEAKKDLVNDLKEFMKQLNINPELAEVKFHIDTHWRAVLSSRERRPHRFEMDMENFMRVFNKAIMEYGIEEVRKIKPKGIQFEKISKQEYDASIKNELYVEK